nr:DUF6514 family protein [uncultured Agathobaculum sp.]
MRVKWFRNYFLRKGGAKDDPFDTDEGYCAERMEKSKIAVKPVGCGKRGVQKMVHYIVTKSQAAEGTQYGITAVCGQAEFDSIADIAPTFEETARLAALLQENGVAVEHFRDIVEDYLVG